MSRMQLKITPPPCPSCGSIQCATPGAFGVNLPSLWACRTCGQSFQAELQWRTPQTKKAPEALPPEVAPAPPDTLTLTGPVQAGLAPAPAAPAAVPAPPAAPQMYLDAAGPTFSDRRFTFAAPQRPPLGGLFLSNPAEACHMLISVLETAVPVHAHARGERVKGCPVCQVLEAAVGR